MFSEQTRVAGQSIRSHCSRISPAASPTRRVSRLRREAAFRQELALCVVLVLAALWLGKNGVEWALMIGSLLLVLIVELLNSGIEAVVDRFGDELHELSGRAKDMGSAAVMISLLNVPVIWGLVIFT